MDTCILYDFPPCVRIDFMNKIILKHMVRLQINDNIKYLNNNIHFKNETATKLKKKSNLHSVSVE